jgi:nucleoid-associated protein YgaU
LRAGLKSWFGKSIIYFCTERASFHHISLKGFPRLHDNSLNKWTIQGGAAVANQIDSEQAFSGVAQTAAIGSSTSVSSGAAKIFREFKWGLLTLFILMTVVVCLVYDGGRGKKKTDTAAVKPTPDSDANRTMAEILPPAGNEPLGGSNNGTLITNPGNTIVHADEPRDPWHSETPSNGGQVPRSRAMDMVRLPDAINDGPIAQQPAPEKPAKTMRGSKSTDGKETATRTSDKDQNAAPTNGAFKWYTVKSGDNLTRIANANLPGKGGNKAILDANKEMLPNANLLHEGMKIKIPSSIGSTPAVETAVHGNAAPVAGNRTEKLIKSAASGDKKGAANLITQDDYVVQTGDSLERIARKVLNDSRKWKELLEWNKDRISDGSKIKVGMALRTHPNGQAPAASPSSGELLRSRTASSTMRADAEPANMREVAPPNAEEVLLSIHPIAANTTAAANRSEKSDAVKSSKAGKSDAPAKDQAQDDDPLRGVILP